MERSNPQTLWMAPVGLVTAEGTGRVKPLSPDFWQPIADRLFGEGANVILCTDGAVAYERKVAGVLQHFAVDRYNHVWTRPEMFLYDLLTGELREQLAGSQTLDSEWERVKTPIPKSCTAQTEEGLREIDKYVRFSQWCRFLSGKDR